jgi:hypothetical protein
MLVQLTARRRRTVVLLGLLAGLLVSAAAVVGAQLARNDAAATHAAATHAAATHAAATHDAAASDAFWSHFHLNAVSENFESVVDMMKSSDVVVVGRLGPLEESRSWVAAPELGPEGIAFYAMSSVSVERVVHGNYDPSAPGILDLELFVPVPSKFEELRESQPKERILLFLFRKDELDAPVYGLVSVNRGYIRDLGRAEPPVGADDEWLMAVRGETFDDLVRQLEAASAQGE